MTLETPLTELKNEPVLTSLPRCGQRISNDGRIMVSKKAWAVRISSILVVSAISSYIVYQGLQINDPLVIFSTLMPLHTILYSALGWFLYKSPAKGKVGNDLVSVIIPVYNQKAIIKNVIEAIYQSTYKNIEVIVVNDGSNDGTHLVLDDLATKYTKLRVIHKQKNEGKRKAVATGVYTSSGKYVVLIDSDSIVEKHAVTEFMKAFKADSKIGAVVGYAKPLNAEKNILTRCQDAWYDFSFNIRKTSEHVFGSVLCCSGCLAAYRREAIINYIPYWAGAKIQLSDDRELTSYLLSAPLAQKLMESMTRYDDAEDRGLTAQALLEWKSVYVPTAIVYTEVPEKFKVFLKQQKRWKKGTTRVNFFTSAFFWRKNPIMSLLIFYIEFMMTFTTPLVLVIAFFYVPFILNNVSILISFLAGHVLTGFVNGLDYKFRDPLAKNWKYKPLMNLMASIVLSWLIFPAIWSFRKNEWETR